MIKKPNSELAPIQKSETELKLELQVQLFTDKAKVLKQLTPGSAGYDLYSAEEKDIPPQDQMDIRTDIAVKIPEGYYRQIKSRSGLAFNHKISVNSGVIDSDYTGNIKILLVN